MYTFNKRIFLNSCQTIPKNSTDSASESSPPIGCSSKDPPINRTAATNRRYSTSPASLLPKLTPSTAKTKNSDSQPNSSSENDSSVPFNPLRQRPPLRHLKEGRLNRSWIRPLRRKRHQHRPSGLGTCQTARRAHQLRSHRGLQKCISRCRDGWARTVALRQVAIVSKKILKTRLDWQRFLQFLQKQKNKSNNRRNPSIQSSCL